MTLKITNGFHHITMVATHPPRTLAFYRELMGLPLVKQTVNQDDATTKHLFWAHYDGKGVGPNSSLTLFGWPHSTHRARPGSGQTHHIAFRASSEEEQLEWRDHLMSMGIGVSPVMDRMYFKSSCFQAPDGLLVEVATDGPGFVVDEESEALGRRLQLPPWLEKARDEIEGSLQTLEVEVGNPHA